MIDSFLTVGSQVLILFLLIGVGVVCGRTHLLNAESARALADLALFVATPCVIIRSFERPVSAQLLCGLGVAALAAVATHLLGMLLARLCVHDKEDARQRILRFGVVFSNAGYMAIPLQQALLGDDGVFYGAIYVAVFNLVLWSYGVAVMGEGRRSLSPRKWILNPGVLGVAAGLLLLFSGITLPSILSAPIDHLANLNTPLPMLLIGYYLSEADIKTALRDRACYLTIFLRLAAVPLLMLGGLWLCGVRGTVLVSAVVGASAPVATATTMFAARYRRDPTLSVNLVVLSTLFSVITMPLIVGLATFLA